VPLSPKSVNPLIGMSWRKGKATHDSISLRCRQTLEDARGRPVSGVFLESAGSFTQAERVLSRVSVSAWLDFASAIRGRSLRLRVQRSRMTQKDPRDLSPGVCDPALGMQNQYRKLRWTRNITL
jgi:hypothetical protein